jgi:hypothetical protein
MTSERIKEIQQQTAYPDSISVQQALLQVWNECNTSSQTEISDEMTKIEKALYHAWSDYEYQEGNLYSTTFRDGWLMAIDWYKKQLNNK